MAFERGNFERYTNATERAFAEMLDLHWGHSHCKTAGDDDMKKHIDIDSLNPGGDLYRWEAKDTKRVYREGEKQNTYIILEHQTVARMDGSVFAGWGYSKGNYLAQRLSETAWLLVPMTTVRVLMAEVDWTKVYFKPGGHVLPRVAYTRNPTFGKGMTSMTLADGTVKLTRGDIVAHWPLTDVVKCKGVRVVENGKLLSKEKMLEIYG